MMHVPNIGTWPMLGSGVGLRPPHYSHILENRPKIDWFEAVSENYMDTRGRPLHILETLRRDYPIVLHGVSMSIGSTDELDLQYLKKLKELIARIEPSMVSDHLCWTSIDGNNLHDLLPLPYTEEALEHVVTRIKKVQDYLGRQIILENPSTYVRFTDSRMSEWEFLKSVSEQSSSGILLDINNVYVNAFNHQFDPTEYLDSLPADRIAYFHMAGFTDMGDFYFDTHDGEVIEGVWNLYRHALSLFGDKSTLIEWDAKIPDFAKLESEISRAKKFQEVVHGAHA